MSSPNQRSSGEPSRYERPIAPNEPRVPLLLHEALRRDMSTPERVLWSRVRDRRLGGLKIRRQHPIGPYVADFYCHEAGLVIELDGSSHMAQAEQDRRRDAWMAAQGLFVLRVGIGELATNEEPVLARIYSTAVRLIAAKTKPAL